MAWTAAIDVNMSAGCSLPHVQITVQTRFDEVIERDLCLRLRLGRNRQFSNRSLLARLGAHFLLVQLNCGRSCDLLLHFSTGLAYLRRQQRAVLDLEEDALGLLAVLRRGFLELLDHQRARRGSWPRTS